MTSVKAAAWLICGLFLSYLLTSCATPPQTGAILQNHSLAPARIELTQTPFFPQQRFQCGPAALATLLNWSGVATTPEQLAPQVYLPEKQGSLQAELLGASRRHQRIPYTLQPRLDHLLQEVAAGHPVLVLQNLALSWYPRWHYAVVVGYDLEQGFVILRSGTEQRKILPLALFERTWARGNHWAMVVLPPDQLPASAEEAPYLKAVASLERLALWQTALTGYQTASSRWPHSAAAHFAQGNAHYQLGHLQDAETAYRETLVRQTDFAPALNNLALLLAEQKRFDEAMSLARRAVEIGGDQAENYQNTLRGITSQINK